MLNYVTCPKTVLRVIVVNKNCVPVVATVYC